MNKKKVFYIFLASSILLLIYSISWFNYSVSNLESPPQIIRPHPPFSRVRVYIENSLNKLPLGIAFHNVPINMRVGESDIIEAGMVISMSRKEIEKELLGSKDIKIKERVRYNPIGVKMFLDVDKEAFKTRLVSELEQPVISQMPSIWRWEITPIKSGRKLVILRATSEIKVPELNINRKVNTEIFKDIREVKVNLSYSTTEFIGKSWKEIVGILIGSGSLVGFISWAINKRNSKPSDQK